MGQQSPLRVQVICPDAALRAGIEGAFQALGKDTVLYQTLPTYPARADLARELRILSPDMLFVSFEDVGQAALVVRYIQNEVAGMPVVALYPHAEPAQLVEAMRAGARDFLTLPFEPAEVGRLLRYLRSALAEAPVAYATTEHIYSVVPAKPGVGATTVAINLGAAFAQESGMKVLLADMDLSCGMIQFLLKLPRERSVVDALARVEEMDTFLWPQLVTTRDGLDVLHSGGMNPQAHWEIPPTQGLIDFARRRYRALFFDMSGNLERHSMYLMQESRRILVVCNPEIGSLYQAREKIRFLDAMGWGDRVAVIVNRWDQALAVPMANIPAAVGAPVVAAFDDDHFEVRRAIEGARTLLGSGARPSKLGAQFREFAARLAQGERPQAAAKPADTLALAG